MAARFHNTGESIPDEENYAIDADSIVCNSVRLTNQSEKSVLVKFELIDQSNQFFD